MAKKYEIHHALMRELDEALLNGFRFSGQLTKEVHWTFRRAIESYAERGLPFVKGKSKGGGDG